ncbi:MAG: hypothetical protein JRN16_06280 [Nitrososphaerota archaeon]|nr:hypothetical protein [Nitrososphaerota archaeon]MDG7027998.1 hypothetical protein [Nitrososphaerota archaeon]
MTERVPGWLQRVLLPRLSEMGGDIKAINARIEGVDSKLGEMDKRLSSNDAHLEDKIDSLDKKLDVAQRLAVLETKMSELHPGR